MSKHETWRTRKYWQSVGGLLIEEFRVTKKSKSPDQENRYIDAVIVLNEPKAFHDKNTYDLSGKDVIVVQTKRGRIGMYLLGQTFFSAQLIKRHKPRSIKAVAICGRNDSMMEELAKNFEVKIIVISDESK
jgi:hypothetical protein